ncbi:MAG: EMC3/TMCO1 family protein [Candidatus Micrarchaeia archaeon]
MSDMISILSIAAIGAGISFLITFLIKKFSNRQRMMELQKEITKLNKELLNDADKEDLEQTVKREKEEKLHKMAKESIMLGFNGIIIMLLFLIICPWIVKMLFPDFIITLPFSLPVAFRSASALIEWRNTFGASGWFWIVFGSVSILQLIASSFIGIGKKNKQDLKQ